MVLFQTQTSLTALQWVWSLSRRGKRYPPKLAQAFAYLLMNAARFCYTKGDMFELFGGSGEVAKCCERSGQTSFVVDAKYHLS